MTGFLLFGKLHIFSAASKGAIYKKRHTYSKITSEDAYLFFLKWLHLLRFKSINPNFSVAPCQIHLHSVKDLILGFRTACSVQLRPRPIQNGSLIKKRRQVAWPIWFSTRRRHAVWHKV